MMSLLRLTARGGLYQMNNLKNNLFKYATKELSQDAFICWLCSFSLEEADKTDEELVRCSNNLLHEFMKRKIENVDSVKIHLLDVERQVDKIDVLLTVEYAGVIFKIIVEDKIHTSEHDNQLKRYKDKYNKEYDTIGIYFKTGFQSDKSEVSKAGYSFFGRKDILDVLKDCKSTNSILRDYREYWENYEKITQSYRMLPMKEWEDSQAVNGFYEDMQGFLIENGCWAGFGYVPNPSGGFWGLWYGPDECRVVNEDNFKASLYLQVETKWNDEESNYEYKICVKYEAQTEDKTDKRIYEIREIILNHQESHGFKRPKRLG